LAACEAIYIVGTIKLVFDEAIYDRAFADTLITYEYYFEFDRMLFICGVAYLIIVFVFHFCLKLSL